MRFRVLGPLQVWRDGRELPLPAGRQRAALAALLLRANSLVPIDELLHVLWSDEPPGDARATAQTHVGRLRGTLGTDRIGTRPGGYLITVAEGELDVAAFDRLLARAGAADDRDGEATLLDRALSLWHGPPLSNVPSDLLHRSWVPGLAERRLRARERRIDLDLAAGNHAGLVCALRELTCQHPLRERFWGQLMTALAGSGCRAEALRAFQDLRHRLAEELGTDPAPELQELHRTILRGAIPSPGSGPPGRGSTGNQASHNGASGDRAPAPGLASRLWEHQHQVHRAPLPPSVVPPPQLPASITPVELVERQHQLADLDAAWQDAAAGRGRLVLVTGEAGAGKTALVRRFAAATTGTTAGTRAGTETGGSAGRRCLWGVCDELLTPRPLGPFRDMSAQLDAAQPTLDVVVAALARPPHPAVAVIEDAQWADDATRDAIRFLGRRIGRTPALLIVTYREEEVPADHPLRRALGTVPPDDLRRVRLPPLSAAGVARLAGRDDVADLHQLTGGNPFYLTEVLAAPDAAVPHTVQDAVMARVGRLGEAAQECVRVASVVPGRVERWILAACGVTAGLDEAARAGVLHAGDDLISFPHELARRAVEHGLAATCRAEINQRILDALAARDGDPARLAHHAALAGDAAAVARYAPLAARLAVSLDSHREAVAHFRQALDHADRYPSAEQAALWLEYALACYQVGEHQRADEAIRHAIEIADRLGDQDRVGGALSLHSDILWFLGRGADAARASARAIEVLEPHPPVAGLARAYAQHAKLAMVDHRDAEAARYGERAIALARELGETPVLTHAMNTVGMVRWRTAHDNSLLRESLDTARAAGLAGQAGRGYANLAAGHLQHLEHERAGPVLAEGLAFCEAHNLDTTYYWLLALRSQWHMEQGRWTDSAADAAQVLAVEPEQMPALIILGTVQARRGEEAAGATLARAARLADRHGDAQRLLLAGRARLEHAWLQGTLHRESALGDRMAEFAHRSGLGRSIGEAALWQRRAAAGDTAGDTAGDPAGDTAGAGTAIPAGAAEPYALQLAGRWREAAAAWAARGLPYAQAEALAEAPEPAPLYEALDILHRLGAGPLAAMVRQRLADLGVTRIPRGPRPSTQASPVGLTARQTEVLGLLADGLTYREIAGRLRVSIKTVDHHVAAVRRAFGARTRAAAVEAARRSGILSGRPGA